MKNKCSLMNLFEGSDIVNSGWLNGKQVAVFHLEKMKYDKVYDILDNGKKAKVVLLDSDHLVIIPQVTERGKG